MTDERLVPVGFHFHSAHMFRRRYKKWLCLVSVAEVGDGGTPADNLGAGSGELEGKSSNVLTG